MSFRTRLYGSVSRGTGTLHGESPEPTGVHASLDRTFSAKDARKSLTKDEFAKSSRVAFTAANINIDDEADKYFAFAISRTNRQGYKSIFATLRGAGDSAEEILSGLCGASALSDVDLIRLTSLDCGILKSFLTHEQVVVRSSAVSVCGQIALRMWDWFTSDPTDAGGDLETTQQDIRSWIVQVWRAIADRYADEDDSVAQLSFEYLDQMAATKDVLFERVCRHLLSAVTAVGTRASSLRSTPALRFATRLLMFALNENRPHELSSSVNGPNVYHAAHSFLMLALMPSAEGEQNMNGDVCLTSAECALDLTSILSSFSSYDSGRVKACCVNAALSQLRALESPDLLLPDSCRLSRRRRCARILFQAGEVPTHLPRRQRIRVLGRCAALCATDNGLRALLAKCTLAIVDVDLNHPHENCIHALLESERGILRSVWTGPDKPRHRLAVALLEAVLAKYPTQLSATASQRKSWNDLSMRMIEACAECLTWGDFSLRNHRAGHAFVDLLCRRLFVSVHHDDEKINNKGKYLDLTGSPELERFIRASIEWRIKAVPNIQVRARLLYVCTRAFCAFPNTPDLNLGKILVDAARHLAVMPDPNVFAPSSNPLEAEPLHLGHAVGGLFSLALAILAHLARQVPSLRNAVAAAYGHLSTLSDDLALHERQLLAERTKELERPKSFAFGLPPLLVSPGQSPSRSPSHPLDSSHWLMEQADFSNDAITKDNHSIRISMIEKQLSGGSDPLYVIGVVAQSETDETRLVATLKMINISNLKIRRLQVEAACRGNIKMEDGYEHCRRIERDVDPGETVILKLALIATKEEAASSCFAGRRGVDIKVGFDEDIRYSLAPWTFTPLLFLEPAKSDWESFRYLWTQCQFGGSTTKCECTVNCTEEQLWPALDAAQNWMHIVVKSQRMVALSAQTCDNKAKMLICGFISHNSTGSLTIALEFRSLSKSLFFGFDSREFIVEALFPSLPVRVLWSNSTNWPGAIAASGRAEEGDEFVAPDSVWAAASVGEGDEAVAPSLDVMTASVRKWQQLQQQRQHRD